MISTNRKPLISVIIPIHNTEMYLRKCLDSVVNQTIEDIEIILVNDGSTDGSGDICDEYADTDARIKVIHAEKAKICGVRNIGIEAAVGQWVGFVDSDDYIEPDMYEKLLQSAVTADKKLAACGFVMHRLNGVIDNFVFPSFPSVMTGMQAIELRFFPLNQELFTSHCCILYHHSFFEGSTGKRYNETCYIAEDALFIAEVLCKSDGVVYIAEALYNYIERESSRITSGYDEKYMTAFIAYRGIVKAVEKTFPQVRREIRLYFTRQAIALWKMVFHQSKTSQDALKYLPKIRREVRRYAITYLGAESVTKEMKIKYIKLLLYTKGISEHQSNSSRIRNIRNKARGRLDEIIVAAFSIFFEMTSGGYICNWKNYVRKRLK